MCEEQFINFTFSFILFKMEFFYHLEKAAHYLLYIVDISLVVKIL